MNTEDQILSTLDESAQLIFKSLMSDAEDMARYYVKEKSKNRGRAISLVAENLCLNDIERDCLIERMRQLKPEPEKTEILNNSPASVDENIDRKNVIYFEDENELNEATQLLMDKSIDWAEKTSGDRSYIQFADSKKLSEAHNALQRRWDFVESKKRLVADVQFDNLSDYTKVLEFMRRQGMILEYNSDIELDEDYDQSLTKMAEGQKDAEKANKPHAVSEGLTSFTAKSRSVKTRQKVDPVNEAQHRATHIRRTFRPK